jgi:hypothetical protein
MPSLHVAWAVWVALATVVAVPSSSQRPIIGFTAELERQAGDDAGREKDRQKALPVHRKATVWLSAASKVSVRMEFCHCEFAGCDVQVRLISRSFRSSLAIWLADRQPRCRTCHVGPRLRLLYASSSGLLSSSISIVYLPCNGTFVLT